MKVPRVQFTVRRLMILVAVFAILMGAGRTGWHMYCCWKMAEAYALMGARGFLLTCGNYPPTAQDKLVFKKWDKILAVYHISLEKKYRRAVWRPWELVLPDPPYPEFPMQ